VEAKKAHWVVNGKFIRDYNMEVDIPDVQTFLQSLVLGTTGQPIKTEYTNVLICALPKSGSMYTWQLISSSIDYDKLEVGFNFRGGNFYYPRMLAAKYTGKNTISHCHKNITWDLAKIIELLDLKIIVNTRNLLDTLISRYDLIQNKGFWGDFVSPVAIEKYLAGDIEYQLDVIVELFANEYISFYTSWGYYEDDVMRTTYDEMVDDEVGLVQRVAEELGCEVIGDVEKISKQIKEAGGINFNKGISGRGSEMFNDRQKEEIRRRAGILGCTNEEFLDGC